MQTAATAIAYSTSNIYITAVTTLLFIHSDCNIYKLQQYLHTHSDDNLYTTVMGTVIATFMNSGNSICTQWQ